MGKKEGPEATTSLASPNIHHCVQCSPLKSSHRMNNNVGLNDSQYRILCNLVKEREQDFSFQFCKTTNIILE